jgi:ABC-type transport system involved in multi-copper enzyme maturation permease subunit
MLNLIKMDFYRLFRTKAVRVGAIAAVLFAFFTSLLNLGIVKIIEYAMEDDPNAADGMSEFFSVVGWMNGVDFAQVILTGTGMLSLFLSCMIAASYIGGEQSCGFAKNVAGQIPNRGLMIVSKFTATCFIHLMVLAIYTCVCSIFAPIFFGSYITSYSIGTMIGGLALRFILFCAINAVLLFFCTLAKSHAVAMVIGAIFGIGVTSLIYMLANMLLSLVNIKVDIAKLMPDGINGLISASSLGDIVARAIIVTVVFISVFLTGAALLYKKRDVK